MTMAGDLDLSSLPKIPVKPHLPPPIPTPHLLLIVCGLPPSPTHGCWRIAMKGSFIHPLSLTPITITTHIHQKDLGLFALSPKKGGR